MSGQIKISVVIPTKGRTDVLIGTLKSLLAQTVRPFEIIVMDQNSPPLPEINQFVSEHNSIKHVFNSEPGHVLNYNRALEAARGDVVLFLDDDVVAQIQLIENLTSIYERDAKRELAGVAGRVLNAYGDLPVKKIKKVGYFDFWRGIAHGNFNFDQETYVDFAQGAQMSFRREKIWGVGAFDYAFIGNAYFFETDLCLKLRERGYKILFSPKCTVDHLMAPRGGARIIEKSLHTYYYTHNGVILELRHGFIFQWPFYFLWTLVYLLLKSIYNHDLKIFTSGLKGLGAGLIRATKENK